VDGSGNTPGSYLTIQDAVNAVHTAATSLEQTIFVQNSVADYKEIVTILADNVNVNIVGLASDNSTGVNWTGGLVNHFNSTVTLSNFIIVDDGKHVNFDIGTSVGGSTSVLNVENCDVFNGTGDLLFLGEQSGVFFKNCNNLIANVTYVINSNTDSAGSSFSFSNCPNVLGVTSVLNLNSGIGAIMGNINNCTFISNSSYVINLTGTITVYSYYSSHTCVSAELFNINGASAINAFFNYLNSSAASTNLVIGTGTYIYSQNIVPNNTNLPITTSIGVPTQGG